jgi:phenylacetate-coenzyme A ligase PaaK-like adenylate-forming protein
MHFEALPLVKYAVGDIVEIDTAPCPCGARGVRLHFVERSHDVVSVYGLKFGYRPIEAALVAALGVDDPLVQLVLTDAPKGMAMTVKVCRDHDADEQRVRNALYAVFEIDEMLDMGYLSLSIEHVDRAYFDQRKLRRVLDLRSDVPFDADADRAAALPKT